MPENQFGQIIFGAWREADIGEAVVVIDGLRDPEALAAVGALLSGALGMPCKIHSRENAPGEALEVLREMSVRCFQFPEQREPAAVEE